MALDATGYREDVEQARRRFAEFRQAHVVRSRLPEELWATAAKLARRDGITATARVLGVDRPSLQKWTDRLEPRASTKPPKSRGRRRLDGSAAPAFVELLTASTGTERSRSFRRDFSKDEMRCRFRADTQAAENVFGLATGLVACHAAVFCSTAAGACLKRTRKYPAAIHRNPTVR